jgi:hypothetical protein
MQVNPSNAAAVAAIFETLSDARFQMRTVDAVKRAVERRVPGGEALIATATECGCPILHRNRDNLPLITRPITGDGSRRLTWTECRRIADRADAGESFELGSTYRTTYAEPELDDADETPDAGDPQQEE